MTHDALRKRVAMAIWRAVPDISSSAATIAADAAIHAVAEAMRDACANVAAERGAWASNDADAESLVDRLEARGRMDAASEIAAAIRARGKDVKA